MRDTKIEVNSAIIRRERWLYSVLAALFTGFSVFDVRKGIVDDDWFGMSTLTAGIATIVALVCIRGGIRVIFLGSAQQNYISLNSEALSYSIWGRLRKWPWKELPSFEVTRTPLFDRKVISFTVPDDGDWSVLLGTQPGVKVAPDKLAIRIANVYDSPIEEIATHLNEYRDRALSNSD